MYLIIIKAVSIMASIPPQVWIPKSTTIPSHWASLTTWKTLRRTRRKCSHRPMGKTAPLPTKTGLHTCSKSPIQSLKTQTFFRQRNEAHNKYYQQVYCLAEIRAIVCNVWRFDREGFWLIVCVFRDPNQMKRGGTAPGESRKNKSA